MSQTELVSIISVTFNNLPYTQLFLESIKAHVQVNYQLLVVDNNSQDETGRYLQTQSDWLTVICNETNRGFGPACNQAFSSVTTPYTLVLNNDTYVFPEFVTSLLKKIELFPQFAQLGVHSNCINAQNPWNGQPVDQFLTADEPSDISLKSLRNWIDQTYQNKKTFFNDFKTTNQQKFSGEPKLMQVPPDFIGGWGFLVKTEAVRRVGSLFDERFMIGFFEDVDLSWRLAQAGWKVGLAQDIYLHHFNHVSFNWANRQNDGDEAEIDDRKIATANAVRFAEKWGHTVGSWLKSELSQGRSLNELIEQYHVIRLFFKQKDQDKQAQINKQLKQALMAEKDFNLKQFLIRSKQEA